MASPAERRSTLVWSIVPAGTRYFEPSASPLMINYRVDDCRRLPGLETTHLVGEHGQPA